MQINTKGLTHIFDKGMITEHLAIDNVDSQINQGEFLTIIGHTGSGKTTYIEHLNALLLPHAGEITIDNQTIVKTRRKIKGIKEIRKKVGIVFQFAEYQLFEETIEKDIIFGPVSMGIAKDEAKKLAIKYIQLVGLDVNLLQISPFSLSGGQKRRVAIAGILAMEPDILIFDEPIVGLDPQGKQEMYKIFTQLHKKGKTIIIVTHNLDYVLQYSQRTFVFQNAKLVRVGNSVDIMYDSKFLLANQLQPPQIVTFVKKLEKKCQKIGKVRSVNELAKKISKGRQWIK